MDGKIVYEGTSKSGRSIYFRYPTRDDVQVLTDHINSLSSEQTYILWQGAQMTFEQEKTYLDGLLERVKAKKAIPLLAMSGERLMGWGSIEQSRHAEEHVGDFNIGIQKEFRGDGIGRLLMQHILAEAEKEIQGLKIIRLGVFANNPVALEMYKSLGFVEFGNLPNGLLHKGEYVDHIYMYKVL